MIVSHKHRFIFFAVPKTATHTIRQALRAHMGPGDWEQQMLFGKQSLPIPELAKIQHGHISARQLRPHIEADIWHSYFKFGFVRNPYDRFVSTCFFLHRENPGFAASATQSMKDALARNHFRERVLVKPQLQQLTAEDGSMQLDYVGRYESLQHSYDEICSRLKLPTTMLGRNNTSRHGHPADYYDDELRQLVKDFYAQDLQTFAYDFPASQESLVPG